MKHAPLVVGSVILALLFAGETAFAQMGGTGIGWGFSRTYWDGKWYEDGYAEAGTGGNLLSLRREMPVAQKTSLAVYGNFAWMRHTTTTLREEVVTVVRDSTEYVVSGGLLLTDTYRTYFREIDLGINFNRFLMTDQPVIYIGGGPLVRWGQAGKRNIDADPPGEIYKAAWFGINVLAGYRTTGPGGATAYFEPHLIFSPDQADRWQETYPPVNLNFEMGILW